MELADDAGQPSVASLDRISASTAVAPSPGPAAELNPDSYVPKTLRHLLHARGRLSFQECLQLGLALATALEHLHGHDLIHRDIKPSNIIFVNGRPKLADIGLV